MPKLAWLQGAEGLFALPTCTAHKQNSWWEAQLLDPFGCKTELNCSDPLSRAALRAAASRSPELVLLHSRDSHPASFPALINQPVTGVLTQPLLPHLPREIDAPRYWNHNCTTRHGFRVQMRVYTLQLVLPNINFYSLLSPCSSCSQQFPIREVIFFF